MNISKRILSSILFSPRILKRQKSITLKQNKYFASSAANMKEIKIGVQGAPLDKGQGKIGVNQGPNQIRGSGFIEILRKSVGVDLKDYGDIAFEEETQEEFESNDNTSQAQVKNLPFVSAANKKINESTQKIIKDGRICLTLGGDHSIAIGTLSGSSEIYDDIGVLWIDAHSDINTCSTTNSGNLHGMALAFLIQELQPYMIPVQKYSSWLKPRINAKNIAFIGLRDVDPLERVILDTLGIASYSMKEVDRFGIVKIAEMALDKIARGNPNKPLHVSFDIDVLDVANSTGTPVAGGLTLREGITLVEEIRENGRIIAFDLVEVNPKIGNSEDLKRTTEAAKHIILNAFGYQRGGVHRGRITIPI